MRSPNMLLAMAVLVLLVACMRWVVARPTWVGVVTLTVSSTLWIIWNAPIEGATLIVFTPTNGFTVSDILAIIGYAIAIWTVARLRRHERQSPTPARHRARSRR